jgi:hypothetical protein
MPDHQRRRCRGTGLLAGRLSATTDEVIATVIAAPNHAPVLRSFTASPAVVPRRTSATSIAVRSAVVVMALIADRRSRKRRPWLEVICIVLDRRFAHLLSATPLLPIDRVEPQPSRSMTSDLTAHRERVTFCGRVRQGKPHLRSGGSCKWLKWRGRLRPPRGNGSRGDEAVSHEPTGGGAASPADDVPLVVLAAGTHGVHRPWPAKQHATERGSGGEKEHEQQLPQGDEQREADEDHERNDGQGDHEHGHRFADVSGAAGVRDVCELRCASSYPAVAVPEAAQNRVGPEVTGRPSTPHVPVSGCGVDTHARMMVEPRVGGGAR